MNGLLPNTSEDIRLIKQGFSLVDSSYCILITANGPTMTNSSEEINCFHQILRAILNANKIFHLEYFYVKDGQTHNSLMKVLGKFGTGEDDINGNLLLFICTEHQLVITNSYFKHKYILKNRVLRRSKHLHSIDYLHNVTSWSVRFSEL